MNPGQIGSDILTIKKAIQHLAIAIEGGFTTNLADDIDAILFGAEKISQEYLRFYSYSSRVQDHPSKFEHDEDSLS